MTTPTFKPGDRVGLKAWINGDQGTVLKSYPVFCRVKWDTGEESDICNNAMRHIEPSTKFKRSDRIEDTISGERGTIEIAGSHVCRVKWESGHTSNIGIALIRLIPSPKFKPGDRVELVCNGQKGTVDSPREDGQTAVEWDWGGGIGIIKNTEIRLIPAKPKSKFHTSEQVLYAPRNWRLDDKYAGKLGLIYADCQDGDFYWVEFDEKPPIRIYKDDLQKCPKLTKTKLSPLSHFSGDNSIPDEDIVKFQREVNSIIQGPQAMKPTKIETQILIDGIDAKNYTDDQLFEKIRAAEAEIARLEALKTKPKALSQRITELNTGIVQLVAYMDGR